MSKTSIRSRVYPEIEFGGFTRYDGTVAFYSRVQSLLLPDETVVDVGCGRGAWIQKDNCDFRRNLRNLGEYGRHVIGIDVDPDAQSNPSLNEFRLIDDINHWPIETESCGLMVADYVLEHVAEPRLFFEECWRVLKPGGHLCLRAPNSWGYVATIAKLVPNRHHAKVAAMAQSEREDIDVFPTLYRCNTRAKLRRSLQQCGFSSWVGAIEPEPSYMSFSAVAYRVAAMMHRMIPPLLRSNLLVFALKPKTT